MQYLFFISLFTLFFVYVLYGPILVLIKQVKQINRRVDTNSNQFPSISIVIPAYNEELWLDEKIKNTLALTYPQNKVEIIVVTDGSTDGTAKIVNRYKDRVIHLHHPDRNGKVKAMEKGVNHASNEIIVFTDANAIVNKDALMHISSKFADPKTAMVAGEKKVLAKQQGESANGEGLYWKYESWLKSLDSEVSSVIGAAGELFAIRSSLYHKLPADTILDDFMLSTKVLEKGFKVAYEPNAYATEYGSASYLEEWKRKTRIATGGIQSILRSKRLFNFFKYGLTSFSFIIHRASRWTVAPFSLIVSFLLSLILFNKSFFFTGYSLFGIFSLLLTATVMYYDFKKLPRPLLLIVYFTFMNMAAIVGWFRFAKKTQTVNWEKSVRLS